jgi:hypothetical protein
VLAEDATLHIADILIKVELSIDGFRLSEGIFNACFGLLES